MALTRALPPDQPGSDPQIRDRDWVARIRAGDEAAFEAMFTAYFSGLCDFVQGYVRESQAAEELVQDVFFCIWQHRVNWQPEGLSAYLFAACRNRALSLRRHERIVARFEERAAREGLAVEVGKCVSGR